MVAKTVARRATKPTKTCDVTANAEYTERRKRMNLMAVMEEARHAGLFHGSRTGHVSFRAPKALIEAAKRESGAVGPTELGLLALAILAQPDPTAKFLRQTRATLGADHDLDY